MLRLLKITGIAVSVFVGLLILVFVVVNSVPGETYKTFISSGVKSATGRQLTIGGDLQIELSSTLTFKASDVKFSNAEWASRPHMVSAGQIEGKIALFPLIKGILDTTLVVDALDLLLETHSSGRANWRFKESEKAGDDGGLMLRPLIRKLHLNQTRIAFIDGKSGNRIDVFNEKLHLREGAGELPIELQGKFNDIPLGISGGFDNVENLIDNKVANVRLDGYFGETKLVVRGTLGPLTPTVDLNITLGLNTNSIAAFSPFAGRDLPNLGPLSVSLNLTGEGGNYTVSDLQADLNAKTLTATAKGSVADLNTLSGINLEGRANTAHLSDILKRIGFQAGFKLPGLLEAGAVISGNLNELTVTQFDAVVHGQGLRASATGNVKDLVTMKGVRANLSMTIDSIALLSEYVKTDLPSLGPLKASANIASKGDTFELRNIKANLSGEKIQASATGSIGDLLKLKGIDAEINLTVDSLSSINFLVDKNLPQLGPIQASATLTSKGDTFELRNIKANPAGEKIQASATGSIGDLLKMRGINADVNVGVDSLVLLSEYVGTGLPSLGPLKASATIASKGDTFELRGIKANLTGEKIQASATGSIGDILKLRGIDADINIGVDSLASLSEHIKTDLPPLGPIQASATLMSKGETFELRNIKADLTGEKIRASASGSIGDVLMLKEIDAEINLAVDSLSSISYLVDKNLPPSGPLSLVGKLTSQHGLKALTHIAATVKGEGIIASFEGNIADPSAVKEIDMTITLEADSLEEIGKLTTTKLQGSKPLKLKGRVTTSENNYKVDNLYLQLGEIDVQGQVAFNRPSNAGDRPEVSGKLHFGDLYLSKGTTAKTFAEKEIGSEDRKGEKRPDKIFPSEMLPFGLLKSLDADMELTAESLSTFQLQFENVVTRLVLKNGLLTIHPLQALVGKGTLSSTVTINARSKPAVLSASVEMDDATFRYFGGRINFMADLYGDGDSIAAIMAGLDGQLMLDIRDAKLKKSILTTFGTNMLELFNPFEKKEETTDLICAIVRFDIKDGVADAKKTIAAQLKKVTWFGSGKIDLKTEEINFGMHSKSRTALGIDLGALANLVYVGGSLTEPEIQLDPKGMVKEFGKYSIDVATGGITWLAGRLWDRISANSDVCAKILDSAKTKE